MKRPSVKDDQCARCGSDNLMSWTNDRTVICDECGCNHAWPRSGKFYRGQSARMSDEPREYDRLNRSWTLQ